MMNYRILWERLREAMCKLSKFIVTPLLVILFLSRYLLKEDTMFKAREYGPSAFTCDTEEPGCSEVCFYEAFPIPLNRFWNLQIDCVYLPPFVFLMYTLFVSSNLLTTDRGTRVKAPGSQASLSPYIITTGLKVLTEVGFLVAHLYMYGFQVKPLYRCDLSPCRGTVSCSMDNHTEKNIIMVLLLVMASMSLLYNILELYGLCRKKIKQAKANGFRPDPPSMAGHEPQNLGM